MTSNPEERDLLLLTVFTTDVWDTRCEGCNGGNRRGGVAVSIRHGGVCKFA